MNFSQFPLFVLEYEGRVVSKSNYRQAGNSTLTWKDAQTFERTLALLARSRVPNNWAVPKDIPLPDRERVLVSIHAHTLLDAGNVSKSVLDALEGQLFFKDSQVLSLHESVFRTRKNPKLWIAALQLPPGNYSLMEYVPWQNELNLLLAKMVSGE